MQASFKMYVNIPNDLAVQYFFNSDSYRHFINDNLHNRKQYYSTQTPPCL